jgi:hypothetical protein
MSKFQLSIQDFNAKVIPLQESLAILVSPSEFSQEDSRLQEFSWIVVLPDEFLHEEPPEQLLL